MRCNDCAECGASMQNDISERDFRLGWLDWERTMKAKLMRRFECYIKGGLR